MATVADLDVALAGARAVGRIDPDPHRLAPVAAVGQQHLEPGVRVDLDGVIAALWRRREEGAGDVAGGDPVAAQHDQPEVHEVLADTAADAQQVGDGRADVGHAAAILEALRDQADAERLDGRQRGRRARSSRRSPRARPLVGAAIVATSRYSPAASR